MRPTNCRLRRALAGVAATGLVALATGVAGQAADPMQLLWERPARGVIAVAAANSGARVMALTAEGELRAYNRVGELAWTASAGEADRLLLAASGGTAALFARGRPFSTAIQLIGRDGAPSATLDVGEPIDAVTLSRSGDQVVAASGNRLRWFRAGGNGWRTQDVTLDAPVRQVVGGPGASCYIATVGDGIARVTPSRVLWQARGEAVRDAAIATSHDGHLVASGTPGAGRAPGEITVQLRDASGQLRWEASLPGRAPRLRLVETGSALLVAYERPESEAAAVRYRRSLTYLPTADQGVPRWTKGGVYTAPLFAAAGSDGQFVVYLDAEPSRLATDLLLLNAHGLKRWEFSTLAAVSLLSASPDGAHLAAYRRDGFLSAIEVSGG